MMNKIKVRVRRKDELLEEPVKVSNDEVYRMSKELIELRHKVNSLKDEIKRLTKIRDGLQCKKPSQHDLLTYCDAIADSVKGKYGDKKN